MKHYGGFEAFIYSFIYLHFLTRLASLFIGELLASVFLCNEHNQQSKIETHFSLFHNAFSLALSFLLSPSFTLGLE